MTFSVLHKKARQHLFSPEINQSFTFTIHILLCQVFSVSQILFFFSPPDIFIHLFFTFSAKKWPPLEKDRRGRKGHQSEKGVNARPNTCHARRHFRDFPAEKKSPSPPPISSSPKVNGMTMSEGRFSIGNTCKSAFGVIEKTFSQ